MYAPMCEYAPVLEYRRTEFNCNIYNIVAPAYLIISDNVFYSAIRAYTKKCHYMVILTGLCATAVSLLIIMAMQKLAFKII